ncbi:MAG: hypothetical protein ABJK39_08300 [Hyphomicrobiales bacterium]
MMYLIRMLLLLVVLSGLVHIFAILATPFFAGQKIWQNLVTESEPRQLMPLKTNEDAIKLLGQADPAMAYAICRFDLNNGPVTLTSDGPTDFWQVTIYNTESAVIYSLHDGVSQTKQLNLEIRSLKTIQKAQSTLDDNNTPEAAGRPKAGIPVPFTRPLTESELAVAKAEAETGEEDTSIVKTVLKTEQAYVVFKIFRSSRSFASAVEETLITAECK